VALRGCDEILSLRVSPDGKLTQAGRSDSGGKTPRDMKLLPSGRHLIVANQDGANISVFSFSPDDIDTLTKTASLVIDQPMSIAVLPYDPSATAGPFKETL
jgi:6-phosphogluconolactonase